MKFQPPRCPECGYKLDRVYVNIYKTYVFVGETGQYEGRAHVFSGETGCQECGGIVAMDTLCPVCGADLGEVFPDGPCNYDAAGAEGET